MPLDGSSPDPDRPASAAAPILFMHVPKTAGVSMLSGLTAALSPMRTVEGFDRHLFGTFDGFHRFAPHERQRIHVRTATIPADADLVAGHFSFSTLRDRFPTGRLMTVMREPVSRLLSHWLFWRQTPDAALAELSDWADRVRLSSLPLARFLHQPSIAAQTDNVFTRALLWPHELIPDGDFIAPEHDAILLREARRRLDQFDLVELIENDRLEQAMSGWLRRPFFLPRSNETSRMPPPLRIAFDRELTPPALARLSSCSRLDLALWRDVATARLRPPDLHRFRERVIADGVTRYLRLMDRDRPAPPDPDTRLDRYLRLPLRLDRGPEWLRALLRHVPGAPVLRRCLFQE